MSGEARVSDEVLAIAVREAGSQPLTFRDQLALDLAASRERERTVELEAEARHAKSVAMLDAARERERELTNLLADADHIIIPDMRARAEAAEGRERELRERYELLRRAVNDNDCDCLPGCDSIAHEEDCPHISMVASLELAQSKVEELRDANAALVEALEVADEGMHTYDDSYHEHASEIIREVLTNQSRAAAEWRETVRRKVFEEAARELDALVKRAAKTWEGEYGNGLQTAYEASAAAIRALGEGGTS